MRKLFNQSVISAFGLKVNKGRIYTKGQRAG